MTTDEPTNPANPSMRRLRVDEYDAAIQLLCEHYARPISALGPQVRAMVENPKSVVIVAGFGGKLVGCQTFAHWPLVIDGATVNAYQSCHSLVVPEAQGLGLFGQMLREGRRQIGNSDSICYGFPNVASLGSFIRDGWTVVDERAVVSRPLSLLGRLALASQSRRTRTRRESERHPSWPEEAGATARAVGTASLYPSTRHASSTYSSVAGLPVRFDRRFVLLRHVLIGLVLNETELSELVGSDSAVSGSVASAYSPVDRSPVTQQVATGKGRSVLVARYSGDSSLPALDWRGVGIAHADTW